MKCAHLAAALLVLGCKSEAPISDETVEVTTSAQTGSAGGFSASLSAELADEVGSGGTGTGTGTGSGDDSTGSAGSTATAGSAGATAGSAGTTAGSAGATAGSAAGAARSRPAKPPVVVSEELRAIQLEMLPNWERDVEAAGTISRFVTIHSRNQDALFVFHYGYDEPGAPTDRDAYKKFLAENKILKATAERQRGAAWYLQGNDRSGKPAFRFVVNYGGKRLVCYGSMYKQSPLGDIRDEVVLEAQKICESLTL